MERKCERILMDKLKRKHGIKVEEEWEQNRRIAKEKIKKNIYK